MMGDIPHEEVKPPTKTYRYTYYYRSSRIGRYWYKRTLLERILFTLLVLFILICIILSLVVHVLRGNETRDICETPGCVTVAARMIDSMNTSQDPCDDFYAYTCGSFIENMLLPEKDNPLVYETTNTPSVSLTSMMQAMFYSRLRAILELPNHSTESTALQKSRDMYAACMNTELIEDQAVQPLGEALRESVGGWPVVMENWKEENFDWKETFKKLYNSGFSTDFFFESAFKIDTKTRSSYVLSIDPPDLRDLADREGTLNFSEPKVHLYYMYMVNVSVIIGANRTRAENELKDVIDLEYKLQKTVKQFTNTDEETIDVKMSYLNEDSKMKETLNDIFDVLPLRKSIESVRLHLPNAIREVFEIFKSANKRTLADFMIWKSIQDSLEFLNNKFRELEQEYTLHRPHKEKPRWMECLQLVWNYMRAPAAHYVQKHISADAKDLIDEIVEAIAKELADIVKDMDTITERSREEALEKFSEIQHHVYPEEFLSDDILDDFYHDLLVSSSDHFHNMLRVRKFDRDIALRKPDLTNGEPYWGSTVYKLDVYLNDFPEFSNSESDDIRLSLPFNFLVGLNFETDRPRYINYAIIGVRIAVVLIANLPKKVQEKMFMNKAECTFLMMNRKDIPTVLAGIVEVTAAMSLSYNAYQKWVDDNGEEQLLPGLELTQNQLFWLSNAQWLCIKFDDSSSDAPYKAVVKSSSLVLSAFSEDFECTEENSLDPEKKCKILVRERYGSGNK